MSNLVTHPGQEEARAAGQRLLAAREREARRIRFRMKVQFWASAVVLGTFCIGCWIGLLYVLGVL